MGVADAEGAPDCILHIFSSFYGIETSSRQRIFDTNAGQFTARGFVGQRMGVVKILFAGKVDIPEKINQFGNVFVMVAFKGFATVITVGNHADRLHLAKTHGVLFHFAIVLVRLGQAQRPQQLPFGRIVAPLQGIEPLHTHHLRHVRLRGRSRDNGGNRCRNRRLAGAGRGQKKHGMRQQGWHQQ